MIALIVIGWAVALPLCVVSGLFCASKALGHRARTHAATDVDDMQQFARQFPIVLDLDALPATDGPGQPVTPSVSAGAGY